MSPDRFREADVHAWIARAHNDLRAAEVDLRASPPLLEDALFHCQQAVEKAIKAPLTWHDHPFRKTHDLVELGGLVVALDPTLEPLLQEVAPLSEYAWSLRYPGETALPTESEAEAALRLTREVAAAILAREDCRAGFHSRCAAVPDERDPVMLTA